MRRTASIVFFLGVIGCAVFFAMREGERRPAKPEPAAPALPPPAASRPPPGLAAPVLPLDAGHAAGAMPMGEDALMRQIRALVKSQPERAEALAREARRRFPDGADADERDALLVDALINQQRIGRARDETYYYFDHHPGGRFAEHLFTMTGVHPPRR